VKKEYSSIRSQPQYYTEVMGELNVPAALPPGKDAGTRMAGWWAPDPIWTFLRIYLASARPATLDRADHK